MFNVFDEARLKYCYIKAKDSGVPPEIFQRGIKTVATNNHAEIH